MEGSPPGNQIPSETVVKRYKFLWRVFLIFNFALGAYMFVQSSKKERGREKSKIPAEVTSIPAAVTAPPQVEPTVSPPITAPAIVRLPVPEDQQWEIFKWMLDEKRKAKPKNQEEKRCIDEEKAILKEFIRSKSIPSI